MRLERLETHDIKRMFLKNSSRPQNNLTSKIALDTVPLSLLVDPSAACLILREYDQMLHTWNFAVQSTLPVHPLPEVKKKYNNSKLKIIS